MKKTKKSLIFLSCLALFCIAVSAHAVVFESGIPGVGAGGAAGAPLPSLPRYINFLYVFVLGMVGIAAFVSLVIWGTVWVATGIVDKKALALESIKNTFIGIGIALTAYIILNTINPSFTTLTEPTQVTQQSTITPSGVQGFDLPKPLQGYCAAVYDKNNCNAIKGCCWEVSTFITEGAAMNIGSCTKKPSCN